MATKTENRRVFRSIRRWAKENNIKVEDCQYMQTSIYVEINGKRYMIDNCESTSYRTWRGEWAGHPKHIAISGAGVRRYYDVYSQREVIEFLEKKMKEVD